MKSLYECTTNYDENLFYHEVLAAKRVKGASKKKTLIQDVYPMDLVMTALSFGLSFFLLTGLEMETRMMQAIFSAIVFFFLVKQLNNRRRRDREISTESLNRRRAKSNLEISRRAGETCTVRFGEACFAMESLGNVTEYQYEGIRRIVETSEFFMIIWNSTVAIPVEKSALEEPDQWKTFMEEKTGKSVEEAV